MLGDAGLSIAMQGCEAAGGVFAISRAQVPAGMTAASVINPWRMSALRALRSPDVKVLAFKAPAGVSPGPVALQAQSQAANGRRLEAQLVWFVVGDGVYHLAVYADALTPEMTDPFFNELRLQ